MLFVRWWFPYLLLLKTHRTAFEAASQQTFSLGSMDLNSPLPKQSPYISVDYINCSLYNLHSILSILIYIIVVYIIYPEPQLFLNQFPLWRQRNSSASPSTVNYPSFLRYGRVYSTSVCLNMSSLSKIWHSAMLLSCSWPHVDCVWDFRQCWLLIIPSAEAGKAGLTKKNLNSVQCSNSAEH